MGFLSNYVAIFIAFFWNKNHVNLIWNYFFLQNENTNKEAKQCTSAKYKLTGCLLKKQNIQTYTLFKFKKCLLKCTLKSCSLLISPFFEYKQSFGSAFHNLVMFGIKLCIWRFDFDRLISNWKWQLWLT